MMHILFCQLLCLSAVCTLFIFFKSAVHTLLILFDFLQHTPARLTDVISHSLEEAALKWRSYGVCPHLPCWAVLDFGLSLTDFVLWQRNSVYWCDVFFCCLILAHSSPIVYYSDCDPWASINYFVHRICEIASFTPPSWFKLSFKCWSFACCMTSTLRQIPSSWSVLCGFACLGVVHMLHQPTIQ